ncbi:MAG TPA: nuclear transport factor 2 family protein [Pyrinomonadaceae bacterium]|jgi:hypothetical protein
MKKLLLIAVAIFGFSVFCFGSKALADAAEEKAARVPIENYLKGHATGEAEYMKKAFNPGAKIEGYGANGKFISWTLDEYIKGMSGKPSQDESQRKRWIESVEISGKAAVATLKFDYPTLRITDYLLLLKIGDEWKIVNKIFQGEMKSEPRE